MSITALDKNTVKLLRTTQVITTITSAVKELTENAFDANATNIEINLIDSGSTLIEVKDDGCGISKEDANYMALSSYTSKISNFSDLESLETYGFRGEALNALSTIGDVTITTKTEKDDVATCYTIDHYGNVLQSEPCHRATGTTVQVRNLFKRMPVRRQIITNPKKASQDLRAFELLIKCYGICNYFVRVNYRVNGNIVFTKPAMPTLKEAVAYVLGKKITSNMSWTEIEDVETNMLLMVPSKDKRNVSEIYQSGAQFIFVNNRPIRHKELEKAVIDTILEALEENSARKKPVFLLHILMDAANIDVNLEPNKTTVYFKEQQNLFNTLDKHLKKFYGIEIGEMPKEDNGSTTSSYYQDYTSNINEGDLMHEQPACKKRKLQQKEIIAAKIVERDASSSMQSNDDVARNSESRSIDNSKATTVTEHFRRPEQKCNRNSDMSVKDFNDLTDRLLPPDLSDSDSDDSRNFTLVYSDKNVSDTSANESNKGEVDDSPPLEFSPRTPIPCKVETLSQLPVVDLGTDFDELDFSKCSEVNVNEKENQMQSTNVQTPAKKQKGVSKTAGTLEAWSKGHVSGLKGSTDIESYDAAKLNKSSDINSKLMDDTFYGNNACKGFTIFSRHIRSQVVKENPSMSAPQLAFLVSKFWKKLSPEERGYYRDLASDGQKDRESKKKEKESEKNKNRLLNMLEKMKTMKIEKKENLVMRTTVPWDIDLNKVTTNFRNNLTIRNEKRIIGLLSPNLWAVYVSAHIWVLDALRLKREFNICDTNPDQEDKENMEKLLNRWLSERNDLSLLHPIHSLTLD